MWNDNEWSEGRWWLKNYDLISSLFACSQVNVLSLNFLPVRIIIDVSAADSPVMMEQHEYMDKARQYK